MKIAMPVEDKFMEARVNQSFARAPYFLIYDLETKESVFLDNSAALSQGGAGVKAGQAIVDSKAEVLLTPQCGENAASVIKAAGIKMYKTVGTSIMDNINKFNEGKLDSLDEIHGGYHDHGGR